MWFRTYALASGSGRGRPRPYNCCVITPAVPISAGLCATCAFARAIASARGSVFVLCGRSATDPRFRKYPPLPVVRCAGYEPDPPGQVSD